MAKQGKGTGKGLLRRVTGGTSTPPPASNPQDQYGPGWDLADLGTSEPPAQPRRGRLRRNG